MSYIYNISGPVNKEKAILNGKGEIWGQDPLARICSVSENLQHLGQKTRSQSDIGHFSLGFSTRNRTNDISGVFCFQTPDLKKKCFLISVLNNVGDMLRVLLPYNL